MPQKITKVVPYKKLSKFLGVGVFNTVFNVILFDILVFTFGMKSLLANFVSLVVSITISFFLNKNLVFENQGNNPGGQYAAFIIGTFVIQLITQHLALVLLGQHFTIIGVFFYNLLHGLGIGLSKQFVVLNVAKAIGVAFSIALSYLYYDKFVFKNKPAQAAEETLV